MKDYTLNQLVNDYSSYIKTIITNASSTLTEEDKEEVLEDTIFNVYRKLDNISEDVLKSYIAKTARNIVINKVKSNEKYTADSLNAMNDETDFEVIDINSDIENIMFSNDKTILIKNIIDSFSDLDKKIFLDFYYSNRKINEIAKEYKLSKTNIKVKLHRARNTIKNELIKGGYNYD